MLGFFQNVTVFFFGVKHLKNKSTYKTDISEESAVCTKSISGMNFEICRSNFT